MWTARPPTVRTRMEHPPSHWPQIDVTHFSSPSGAWRADSESSRKSERLLDEHPHTAVPAALAALNARKPRRLRRTPFFSVVLIGRSQGSSAKWFPHPYNPFIRHAFPTSAH